MSDATAAQIYRERLYENNGLKALIDCVGPPHHQVLDIGCGNGANMRLLSDRGHQVTGVTLSEAEAAICRERGLDVIVADITRPLPLPARSYDALVMSHVLEHLPWPEVTLKSLLGLLRPGGGVYVALPNVLIWDNRLRMLRGGFRYTETGPMDRTHLRFFDFFSSRRLLENVGLRVVRHFGVGSFPLRPLRRVAPSLAARIDRFVTRHWPGPFAGHIILVGILE